MLLLLQPPPPAAAACRAAGEVLAEVRREFELARPKAAVYDIKFALSDGRTRLRMLQESIGFSR